MKGFFKTFIFLVGVIAVLLGGAYYYLDNYVWSQFYDSGTQGENESVVTLAQQEALNRSIEAQNGYASDRPLVYMIAGIDAKTGKEGRSDALLVALVDKKDKTVDLLSLPRDLRVNIPEKGFDKINAAYAFGGETLAKHTLSTYLDIPVDHYAVINFNGFKQLIDTIGGLEVDVEKNIRFHDRISNKYVELSQGVQTLDGSDALNYSRFRGDAEGDFGRMRRQQQVITEILSQTATLGNIGKLGDIITVLGENMRTDVQFDDATKIALSMAGIDGSSINSLELKSYASYMNGVSYVLVDDSEHIRIKAKLQNILKRIE